MGVCSKAKRVSCFPMSDNHASASMGKWYFQLCEKELFKEHAHVFQETFGKRIDISKFANITGPLCFSEEVLKHECGGVVEMFGVSKYLFVSAPVSWTRTVIYFSSGAKRNGQAPSENIKTKYTRGVVSKTRRKNEIVGWRKKDFQHQIGWRGAE